MTLLRHGWRARQLVSARRVRSYAQQVKVAAQTVSFASQAAARLSRLPARTIFRARRA